MATGMRPPRNVGRLVGLLPVIRLLCNVQAAEAAPPWNMEFWPNAVNAELAALAGVMYPANRQFRFEEREW